MEELQALPTTDEMLQADKLAGIVEFVSATDEAGAPCWAYVAMKPSRYVAYHYSVAMGEAVDLAEYGDILAEGAGSVPPEALREKMIREYGYDAEMREKMDEMTRQAGVALGSEDGGQAWQK